MTLKERIKQLCKEYGISMNKLEDELGFGKGYISKLGSSKPNVNKLQQIADYFGVSLDILMNGNSTFITCTECGMSYDTSIPEDIEAHDIEHSLWKSAAKKFGPLYCYSLENERIKAEGRNVSHNTSVSLEKRCEAQIRVLRCLFSRSVQYNHYDLTHVDFNKYVAMMLGNSAYRKNLEDDLYCALVKKYGTLPGISSGSIYCVQHHKIDTLAAHFDGSDYTEDELEEIRRFAEFVKNKRK